MYGIFGLIKALQRGAIREPMIRKRGKQFYKGTGVGPAGRHTKWGGYVIDRERVRKFVVPNLTDCKLTPYVSHRTPKIKIKLTSKDFE